MKITTKAGVAVKRVKAVCIIQTVVFAQKPEWVTAKTRYQIVDTVEQEDGSVVVHVRKQYSDKADVSGYFE